MANAKVIDGVYTQNGEAGVPGMWNLFSMYLMPLQNISYAKKQNADFTGAAGKFMQVWGYSGSFSRETSFSGPGISTDLKSAEEGTMFYHPAVPFGILGWTATKDKAEVIEFGFSGATSEIED